MVTFARTNGHGWVQRAVLGFPGGRRPAPGVRAVDDGLIALGGFDDQGRVAVRFAVGGRGDFRRFPVRTGGQDELDAHPGVLRLGSRHTGVAQRRKGRVRRAVLVVVGGVGGGRIDQ